MRIAIITSIAILAIFNLPVLATIIHVPDDYTTIQQGIDASIDSDTVLVDSGLYLENILIEDKNITLASLFLTTGDSSYINTTIIDGNNAASVLILYYANSIITGFTIQNGNAEHGGGIYCDNSHTVISANIIKQNFAYASEGAAGGGIYCSYSDAIIMGNVIEMNFVDGPLFPNGGGIYCIYSSPTIYGNTISNNTALNGGGLYFKDSNPNIKNNLIVMNNGLFGGGGLYAENSVVDIRNCTLSGNESDWYKGGAIYFDGNFLTVSNSILFYNIALIEDPEIHLESGSAEVTFSDITGGWAGDGNLNTHPYFRDINNDFHLMATNCGDSEDSPLIDMGNPDILDLILDCDYGLGTLVSDMGTYGGGDSASVSVESQIRNIPSRIALSQNYPNPFNASTMIRYQLPRQSQVIIEIYDLLGRHVTSLQNGLQPAGYHQLMWNAEDISSGVYFYKLQAGDYIETKKMMLIK